jgi:hypothetical protein
VQSDGVIQAGSVMLEGKIMPHAKLTILKKPSLLSQGVNDKFA